MPLLSLKNVSLAYGHHPLLSNIEFRVDAGERVCLVGRNGAGKSTLFRVISGQAEPDDGEIWKKDTLRISCLDQDVPEGQDETVYQLVASGLGELGTLLSEYHDATHAMADQPEIDQSDQTRLASLSVLQHKIEALDGWNLAQKVQTILSKLDLPEDKRVVDCSGGVRRRVLLARALVSEPDVLLLDEPTNHMDIAGINWLEEFLLSFKGALLFITHDRAFLKNMATRIIELDRGVLTSYPGNYDSYLDKKEIILQSEERANAKFDKKLAEEEQWIRKGIKARRTRNEGRVRALKAMREQHRQRLSRQGSASFSVDAGEASGKIVADLTHVSFAYNDHPVIVDLSTRIMRGDRVGIIGPNGAGKSTLLKILLGRLKPDSGKVVLGTRLELAYFDQQREQLDPEKTVRENINDGSDFVNVKGKSRHIISYLRDFLFPAARVDSPVKILSGGERNRLLLAKLFTHSANLMVLDEPTNDLDVDTLELLEDLISDYEGTLILVSHDRAFVDNVVTGTLVFEGDGYVGEYVGGYDDWLRQNKSGFKSSKSPQLPGDSQRANTVTQGGATKESMSAHQRPKQKLNFKESRELNDLPQRIEKFEVEQSEIEAQVADPAFYKQDKEKISATMERLDEIQKALSHCYERWEYLDQFDK